MNTGKTNLGIFKTNSVIFKTNLSNFYRHTIRTVFNLHFMIQCSLNNSLISWGAMITISKPDE